MCLWLLYIQGVNKMIKYFCDICGKDITKEQSGIIEVSRGVKLLFNRVNIVQNGKLSVCQHCYNKIYDYVHKLKEYKGNL